ncbi:MAG: DUF4147 domain-containing protein [Sphingomonas sp.]|uniref:glycerate kinase type-2 family protein n=1 Tax=Sphingomonas sp. TaxID=28214 RepID=UPI00180CB198|nr:DUF4147 domain-containing protein [Sphingomonas sp.]
MEMRERLRHLFGVGVAAVQADRCLPPHLDLTPWPGRTAMIAVGKAAGAMARVALATLKIDEGLVIVPAGHVPPGWAPPPGADVIVAGHPVPDQASLAAGEAALALATRLGADDRLIALISGGGSALMAAPRVGITLADKQRITRSLLAAGATIAEINAVRAALSRIKGGGLAAAASPARVFTYVISDIPGDDWTAIASGPTLAPRSPIPIAAVLARYGVDLPTGLTPTAPVVHKEAAHIRLCATAGDALAAMARAAHQLGYVPHILGDAIEGDAAVLGQAHALHARALAEQGTPVALLSGGETTVSVPESAGKGGRNTCYSLAHAIALDGHPAIHSLAADSDGIDGRMTAAGAFVGPDTLDRLRSVGCDPHDMLARGDSGSAFAAIGDLLITGPTCTNVNDLRISLIN